jgi:hydroxypyruvate isomerase
MTAPIPRRSVLGMMSGGAVAAVSLPGLSAAVGEPAPAALKGRIRHAVCRWCYGKVSLDELCTAAKAMGISGIDLLGPGEWPAVKKYGLVCSLANGPGGIDSGFNQVENHDKLVQGFEALIPKVADAGVERVVCFSGNRRGLSDEQGLANCVKGLKRLMKLAEAKKVTLVLELLNSKVNHKDYQADHTAWGAEVCRQVGSERLKLLYDIYHMQVMEGDLIATIKQYAEHIGHYHTGGVPGRAEIDDTQEVFYPAVMRAIVQTGFRGFVAQEFVPRGKNPLDSLRKAVQICDV